MNYRDYKVNEKIPEDLIEIEKKQFYCPNCNRPFYIAKLPDWMGDKSFYKDMLKNRDEQLKSAYERIRDMEEFLFNLHLLRDFNSWLKIKNDSTLFNDKRKEK